MVGLFDRPAEMKAVEAVLEDEELAAPDEEAQTGQPGYGTRPAALGGSDSQGKCAR